MPSGHSFDKISYLDQATPMLLIAIPIMVIVLLRRFAYPLLSKWGFVISTNVISVDENLPKFFEAVKLQDADWFVKESNYLQEKYKFTFANNRVVAELDNWKVAKKPISGIAWYNILANPYYIKDFNYITVDVPDRESLIVDGDDDEGNDCEQSDMVSILLNLAYVRQTVAKSFQF